MVRTSTVYQGGTPILGLRVGLGWVARTGAKQPEKKGTEDSHGQGRLTGGVGNNHPIWGESPQPGPLRSNMSATDRASKRLTWRKSVVYLCSLLLVSLADPRPLTFAVGCVLVAAAWALRLWAFGHLDKNQLLVTTGPYAHMRNPAYFGTFLAMLGVALGAGNLESTRGMAVYGFAAVLALAFFVFYLPRKMKREYPRLQALFGEEVDRHAANVPDFWPRLRPWQSGQQRSFSWQMVRENHELSWGLVLALVMALIWSAPSWSPFTSA